MLHDQLAAIQIADEDGPSDSVGAEIPVVRVNSRNAVKGSPEYNLLNDPKARAANTRYEIDDGTPLRRSFETNSAGMVAGINFTPSNNKIPRDSRQTKIGKLGRATDVGGHAQACSQGGTCDEYNLFPQDGNCNNSAYKVHYENNIKRALNDPKETVGETSIRFERSPPNSPRPKGFSLKYEINQRIKTLVFENEPHKPPTYQR